MGDSKRERFLVYEMDDSIILKRVKNLEASKNVKELEEGVLIYVGDREGQRHHRR